MRVYGALGDHVLELACLFSPRIETPDDCAIAEELGYRYAWVTDSPTFMADPWITLGRAAERTSRIRLGVCVVTPRMRHLVANAGAAATLNALAPGRVDLVVGTGFTSQAMINKPPARWAEAEAYVHGLRRLLAGEEIEWDGEVVALPYTRSTGISLPAEVAIWVAAHGPKGFDVARRLGDGVVTNPGHGSRNTVWPHKRVFVQVNGTVLDSDEPIDSERVIEAAGPGAALHLHLGAEGAAAGSPEVDGYRARIEAVDGRRRHIETHRGHLTEVTDLERPFVTADLIRRATDTGTAEQVRAHLDELERSGVTGALYFPAGRGVARELRTFASCVL
jgi:5,10-methylenetetrahydromethanopterin reductase